MSSEQDHKKRFAHLLGEELNAIADSQESAMNYAKDQGLDYEQIKANGLRRFKQLQLKLKAKTKKEADESNAHLLKIAFEKARDLIKTPEFSFINFLSQNQIALHNRSIESFEQADIEQNVQEIIYLQLLKEKKENAR